MNRVRRPVVMTGRFFYIVRAVKILDLQALCASGIMDALNALG